MRAARDAAAGLRAPHGFAVHRMRQHEGPGRRLSALRTRSEILRLFAMGAVQEEGETPMIALGQSRRQPARGAAGCGGVDRAGFGHRANG